MSLELPQTAFATGLARVRRRSSAIDASIFVLVTALPRDFVSYLIKSTNFLIFISMQLRARARPLE